MYILFRQIPFKAVFLSSILCLGVYINHDELYTLYMELIKHMG